MSHSPPRYGHPARHAEPGILREFTAAPDSIQRACRLGQSAQVNFSIDMVYLADIAYIDEFAPPKQTQATGGGITINIDNNPAIHITTKNKNTREIEKELANAISQATFSKTHSNFEIKLRIFCLWILCLLSFIVTCSRSKNITQNYCLI